MAITLPKLKDTLTQMQDTKILIDLLSKEKTVREVCQDVADAEAVVAQAQELREKASNADRLIAEYTEKKKDVEAVKEYYDSEIEKLNQAKKSHSDNLANFIKLKTETEAVKKHAEQMVQDAESVKIEYSKLTDDVKKLKADLITKTDELDNSIKAYKDKLEHLNQIPNG